MIPPPPSSTLFPYTTLFRSPLRQQRRVGQRRGPIGSVRTLDAQVERHLENGREDRKSTRLNSSHMSISYAVFCLKKKKNTHNNIQYNRQRALDTTWIVKYHT